MEEKKRCGEWDKMGVCETGHKIFDWPKDKTEVAMLATDVKTKKIEADGLGVCV